MSTALDSIQVLIKALEAGSYDGAPGTLTQGSALQIEDLSSVMNNVTFDNTHIKLQKLVSVESCKSTTAQFVRQLSYGVSGGSAQLEGNIGQEETSDFVRCTVPMSYYSHARRVTIASTMVTTVDGKKSDERAASDAALKLAADIENDIFKGLDDYSNAGVFDGNPMVVPSMPNIHGLALQVRQSDFQVNARDRMFAEYGSDESVVLSGGGVALTQDKIEDGALRSALNFGNAEKLVVDPVVLAAYNKIMFNKERVVLAGSAQTSTGGTLKQQWVSGGTVSLDSSNFLRGKFKPSPARPNGPGAPTIAAANAATGGLSAGTYVYYVSAINEVGESVGSPSGSATAAGGERVNVTITHSGSGTTARGFNVYRSAAGGTAASAKFIGRCAITPNSATTVFVDLGNKTPAYSTGYFIQPDTMEFRELSPYSRIKLATTDLSTPEGHFRFTCLAVTQPRKNVLIDNLKGTI